MRIKKFSVARFRNIIKTQNIEMGNYIVLVGKNNEGKSNLLNALNIAIEEIHHINRFPTRPKDNGWPIGRYHRRDRYSRYDYETDYPKKTQKNSPKNTIIKLYFSLTSEDQIGFKNELNLSINEELIIEFKYTNEYRVEIKVNKNGGVNWQHKILGILRFLSSRLEYNYIQAVRTEDTFMDIINGELSTALTNITSDSKYTERIKAIEAMEQKVADDIAIDITKDLKEWIPNTENVRIGFSSSVDRKRLYKSDLRLFIKSSGTETLLENKGDGIKSLFALSLLTKPKLNKSSYVLAVDEPESHLHPEAIRRLKDTIQSLSESVQVIVATHNPIFINRGEDAGVNLVNGGDVKKVKDISEIREVLGVNVEDNLFNAKYVLIVEGEDDAVFWKNAVKYYGNSTLKNMLKSGLLAIKKMNGLRNMQYTMNYLENSIMKYMFILDHDKAAAEQIEKLEVDTKTVSLLPLSDGQRFIELEDLFKNEFISEITKPIVHIDIEGNLDKMNYQLSWSDKMKKAFEQVGTPWNNDIKASIKIGMVEAYTNNNSFTKVIKAETADKIIIILDKINHYFNIKTNNEIEKK